MEIPSREKELAPVLLINHPDPILPPYITLFVLILCCSKTSEIKHEEKPVLLSLARILFTVFVFSGRLELHPADLSWLNGRTFPESEAERFASGRVT